MRRVLTPALLGAPLVAVVASCSLARDVDALSRDHAASLDLPPEGGVDQAPDAAAPNDEPDATVSSGPCPNGCPADAICDEVAGTCVPCGGEREPCCARNACGESLTCIDGTCRGCGTATAGDNFCCGGNACFGPFGVRCCSGPCNPDNPFTCCSKDQPRCLVCCAVCTDGTVRQIQPNAVGNCDAAARTFCNNQRCPGAACCPNCAREAQSGYKPTCG